MLSDSLEQDEKEYNNIELERQRTIKDKSTSIVESKPYTNSLTMLEIRSSRAYSFYEIDKKRRPRLITREKYNREESKTKRRASWSWGRVRIYKKG